MTSFPLHQQAAPTGLGPAGQASDRCPAQARQIRRGFTLAELTIVIAILGILFGMGVRTFSSERRQFAFNDSLTQTLTLIKAARNRAVTSRAVNTVADEPVIPPGGYGVYFSRSDTPGASRAVLFANTGDDNRYDPGTDLVETGDTYAFSPETVFKSIEKEATTEAADNDINEAVIIFRPPLASATITDNAAAPAEIETLYLSLLSRSSPAGVEPRTIRMNRISGFAELELRN